jgi:hypothetical protein
MHQSISRFTPVRHGPTSGRSRIGSRTEQPVDWSVDLERVKNVGLSVFGPSDVNRQRTGPQSVESELTQ